MSLHFNRVFVLCIALLITLRSSTSGRSNSTRRPDRACDARRRPVNRLLSTAVFALLANGAWAQNLEMRDTGGLRWVCGGVGADERRALVALEAQANLALVFVTPKRGGYLADVELSLFDASAKSARFTAATDGPMCLLRVPAGNYRLEASFGGVRRTSAVAVPADAKKPVRAVFAFPGEPWDGIWASDEEKAQARKH